VNTDTELLRKLVELAEKSTGGDWLVKEHKTPYIHQAVPEYGIKETTGEHIEYLVMTDWEHPQLKGPLIINNIAVGLSQTIDGEPAHLVAMSEDDAKFISAARNAMSALKRLLEAGVPEGWVKCSERMPPINEEVLGYWLNGEQHVGQLYSDGTWHRQMDDESWSLPDSWQFLPPDPFNHPPSEGEQK